MMIMMMVVVMMMMIMIIIMIFVFVFGRQFRIRILLIFHGHILDLFAATLKGQNLPTAFIFYEEKLLDQI